MKALTLSILILFCMTSYAQDITLPAPQKTGGKPLMDVLAARKSNREYSEKELSLQQISNLLWAADGINREDGRRTAPTARNNQQIDIYVYTAKAVYLYDHVNHSLKHVKAGDFRAETASNDFAQTAPLLLLYVANYDRMPNMPRESQDIYGATDCGNISQNVYLFCTSEGLHTVAVGNIYRDKIQALLGFDGKAILGQPVGMPK